MIKPRLPKPLSHCPLAVAALAALLAIVATVSLPPASARADATATDYVNFDLGFQEGLSGPLTEAEDGNLYGVSNAGQYENGCVFRVTRTGETDVIYSFEPYNSATGTNVGGYRPTTKLILGRDGRLYGTAGAGGADGRGTVFALSTSGSFSTIVNFTPDDGYAPGSSPSALIQGAGGYLYGTTASGGVDNCGTVFRTSTAGAFTSLASFTGSNGLLPGKSPVSLLQGSDGNLYGVTSTGGAHDAGSVFKVGPSGGFSCLLSFTAYEYEPASLIQGRDGYLYGTSESGGRTGNGLVFRLSTSGAYLPVVVFTGSGGALPGGGPNTLFQGTDGYLYGTTAGSSGSQYGTVFKLSTSGAFETLVSFTGTGGSCPGSLPIALLQSSDGSLYGTTELGGTENYGTLFRLGPSGEFSSLISFTGYSGPYLGSSPSTLVQGSNGELFGTTEAGGLTGSGTLYEASTSGVFAELSPPGPTTMLVISHLVLGLDGNVYGESGEGSPDVGAIFKLTPDGDCSVLVNFTNVGGACPGMYPNTLLMGADGNLYGTTESGGANAESCGTVFRVTPAGSFTTLVNFTGNSGSYPGSDPSFLVQANDGNLYGDTTWGGADGDGTMFRLSTSGAFSSLVNFASPDGSDLTALIAGSDGNLYGTRGFEGADYDGTVFKMSPKGVFTTLVSFTGNSGLYSGQYPVTVLQGSDGALYGLTLVGGLNNDGTVFKVSTSGAFSNLAYFSGSDGASPGKDPAALVQADDGNLYGITKSGGAQGFGNVFMVNRAGTFFNLANFTGASGACPGRVPNCLILGHDGNLYGSTAHGGRYTIGAIFAVHPADGSVANLYDFSPWFIQGQQPELNSTGALPVANLVLNGDSLYGATNAGGLSGLGTLYSVALTPDITAQPIASQVSSDEWRLTCAAVDPASPPLTYKWTTVYSPPGAPAPVFSINGASTSSHTAVTLGKSGAYSFKCVVTNGLGGSTSTQSVNVGG